VKWYMIHDKWCMVPEMGRKGERIKGKRKTENGKGRNIHVLFGIEYFAFYMFYLSQMVYDT
ncbi:MAG: hypothetical protein RQ761_13205, partial [Bacteroidales bacterium]|nr:hypothetical protein [Bacteroidales bacterium]